MTLQEIIDQLRLCSYECEAGALENNVAFQELERLVRETKDERAGVSTGEQVFDQLKKSQRWGASNQPFELRSLGRLMPDTIRRVTTKEGQNRLALPIDSYINTRTLINGKWVISRPLPGSFLERLRNAWLVLTGKADAVTFIEPERT